MLKKVLFGLFVLAETAKKAGAAGINYTELCTLKAPNPSEFGFVCLEPRAQKYLQCYLPGKVSLLMDCPAGTFCSAKAGEWSSANPCGTSSAPYCGDGEVDPDGDEECEIGGVGCSENCTCEDGFEPTEPYSANCKLAGSGCGDGVMDEGEECEIGGVGCTSECKCMDGFKPQTPASVNCVREGGSIDSDKLRKVCRALTGISEDGSGYACLSENSTEYLRCALSEGVSTMMPCAPGTRCKASVGVFQIYNPCIWESADYPIVIPDDSSSDDESESDSYSEDSQYVPVSYDYGVYCELYGKAGYYCASMVNPQAGRDEFIYCNAKGSYAFELVCAEGSYCNLTGFSDANPCMARTDSATPVCGNGVVERGEECEKGAGCDPETCKCKNGFYPPATPDGTCILNYSAVCEIIHERKNKTETYYFCPTFYSPLADSTVIVECAAGKPVNHTKCPDGKFCSVPGLFTENVCASAAPMCGNGKLEEGEECEAEGVGCDPEMCRCEKGYHATEEPSVNCVKDVEPKTVKSYSELCAAFEIPGYFCAAAFNKSEPDTMALQCGANGALSGEFYCPPGTTCKAKDFTIYNPCEDPAATTRCGDGIISGDEECELGGTGCDEKECTCLPGYVPTVPPSRSCELNDYSKICLDHGLGKDKTLALCLDGFNKSFLICSKDNATASFMTACPPGTSCTNKNEPIDGMPCTAIVAAV